MREKEILKKAIEKAITNEFNFVEYYDKTIGNLHWNNLETAIQQLMERHLAYDLIFSHDFAKVFWGEDLIQFNHIEAWKPMYIDNQEKEVGMPHHALLRYEYHLQQMVLEEDPIKYLEGFLSQKEGDK